uniref:Benzyl alcohol O-benzoyltransferase-like n=1 Tax=Populus alba TaxID=43335 RepID=A0A4U5QFD0_POPAL|nr:hypothetical protein D5086_0000095290 [Populus alba]
MATPPTPLVFKPYDPSMQRRDPVKVIKEALAKTLVFYYPFAGRLREGPKRKLLVECTGKGILLIEADGDVTLEQFGDVLYPPIPSLEELLFDVPGSGGMINCPLLLIQVTRLKCGGIVFAIRLNHTMSDATGLYQFLSAMCEMVTCLHHEYDQLVDDTTDNVPLTKKTHRSFFFGAANISAIRGFAPLHLRHCSTFDVLTAFLWRCRTIALQPNPNDEMRILCIVNARNRFNPPLPRGYYGNCIAYSVAMATAGEISRNSLGFTLELVRKAKANVTEEYMRSVADLLVIKGRPWYTMVRSYLVSDVTRAMFAEMNLGWGKPKYGGPAKGNVASFQIPYRTKKGEDGVLVTLCLPTPAMERFVKELDSTFKEQSNGGGNAKSPLSSL